MVKKCRYCGHSIEFDALAVSYFDQYGMSECENNELGYHVAETQ